MMNILLSEAGHTTGKLLHHGYDWANQYWAEHFGATSPEQALSQITGAIVPASLVETVATNHSPVQAWAPHSEWVSQAHDKIQIGGHEYSVENGMVKGVGVDLAGHDGVADAGKLVDIDIKTGIGHIEGHEVHASVKELGEGKVTFVAREGAMVDVSGDGKVETQIWAGKDGLKVSHDINVKGFNIDGHAVTGADQVTDQAEVFKHQFKFRAFVPHDGVDLKDVGAVNHDLAHQMAVVDFHSYNFIGENFILDPTKLSVSEAYYQKLLENNQPTVGVESTAKEVTPDKWKEWLSGRPNDSSGTPVGSGETRGDTVETPIHGEGLEGFQKIKINETVSKIKEVIRSDGFISKIKEKLDLQKIDDYQQFLREHGNNFKVFGNLQAREYALASESDGKKDIFKFGKVVSQIIRERLQQETLGNITPNTPGIGSAPGTQI